MTFSFALYEFSSTHKMLIDIRLDLSTDEMYVLMSYKPGNWGKCPYITYKYGKNSYNWYLSSSHNIVLLELDLQRFL